MTMWPSAIVAGAVLGLASIPHCAAMCGPIAVFAGQCRRSHASLRYHVARLLAYGVLGLAAGSMGQHIAGWLGSFWGRAVVAWMLAAALALTAVRLWRAATRKPGLVQLRPKPDCSSDAVAEPRSRLGRLLEHPELIGFATAVLPCGALTTAGLTAAAMHGPHLGALTMMAFALSSAGGLVAIGSITRLVAGARIGTASRVLAIALAAGAIVIAVRPVVMLRGSCPACENYQATAK